MTAYIHELLTGMRYTARGVVKETKMPSSQPIIEEVDEDVNASEALSFIEATSTLGQSEKTKPVSAADAGMFLSKVEPVNYDHPRDSPQLPLILRRSQLFCRPIRVYHFLVCNVMTIRMCIIFIKQINVRTCMCTQTHESNHYSTPEIVNQYI